MTGIEERFTRDIADPDDDNNLDIDGYIRYITSDIDILDIVKNGVKIKFD